MRLYRVAEVVNTDRRTPSWVAEFFFGCWASRSRSSFCWRSAAADDARAARFSALISGGPWWSHTNPQGMLMSLGTILLIVLIIALLGGFSGIGGGPFYGTGYYGGGGLGLVIVILLILVLLGKI
jgi:hypothetical protein